MKTFRNFRRRFPSGGHLYALALAGVAALATGCSGIHASKSISPLDFILPGLLQNCPPPPVAPREDAPVVVLAQESSTPPCP